MDWRTWVFGKLSAAISDLTLFGSGALKDSPAARPFAVLTMGEDGNEFRGVASHRDLTVWVHDVPGSYTRIDDLLVEVRNALVGPVTDAGGVQVQWQGDSVDLADDVYGTIVRTAAFRLFGKE